LYAYIIWNFPYAFQNLDCLLNSYLNNELIKWHSKHAICHWYVHLES